MKVYLSNGALAGRIPVACCTFDGVNYKLTVIVKTKQ